MRLHGNEPTVRNFMTVTSRFVTKQPLFDTNVLVTPMPSMSAPAIIEGPQLHNELQALCPGQAPYILALDSRYTMIPDEYMRTFLEQNLVDVLTWTKACDCDNFTLYLIASFKVLNPESAIGMCVGTTPSGGCHAWVVYRNEKGLQYLEPQNDGGLSLEKYKPLVFII